MNTWKLNNSPEQPMDEKKNYNGKLKVSWDKKNGGKKIDMMQQISPKREVYCNKHI